MACTNCASTNLVNIDLTLPGGAVSFWHCRRCEHRWWEEAAAGAALPLPEVLVMASV